MSHLNVTFIAQVCRYDVVCCESAAGERSVTGSAQMKPRVTVPVASGSVHMAASV